MCGGSLVALSNSKCAQPAICRVFPPRVAFRIPGLAVRRIFNGKRFWNPVLDKCKSKLSRWKANYLSLRGRITFIEATLSNLPIYYLPYLKFLRGSLVIRRDALSQ